MGFQFNHVGGGTKTRRPIAIHMQYSATCIEPMCFLVKDDGLEDEMALHELQEYIEAENRRLEEEAGFWSKEIVVRIQYKYCPNLTIVDTPGLSDSGGADVAAAAAAAEQAAQARRVLAEAAEAEAAAGAAGVQAKRERAAAQARLAEQSVRDATAAQQRLPRHLDHGGAQPRQLAYDAPGGGGGDGHVGEDVERLVRLGEGRAERARRP